MCEYIITEDFLMDKYIYDESNGLWYELQGDYYIPCLALLYQPKKDTSLSAYGGSDTNTICRNINGQFTPRFSQAEN